MHKPIFCSFTSSLPAKRCLSTKNTSPETFIIIDDNPVYSLR